MKCQEAKRKRKDTQEAKWHDYFVFIKEECPWSLGAWQQDKLLIIPWTGVIKSLGDLEALVYIHNNASSRLLKKWEHKLNKQFPEYEFLYSHPVHKHYSAPFPCIIQQNRSFLNQLRTKLNK